ncbi:hypothetical protein GWI33_011134 [Rhynchophorus ferrugineus]|uniref:Uncharacterized protein n=1 Tax=Rhynchophorus ferrugineus TaxID=354439 RepID=A0A834MN96_RHYFE|nr:hypothetical protein GWI33_011134 [Rhynchophorus ferrugineus]
MRKLFDIRVFVLLCQKINGSLRAVPKRDGLTTKGSHIPPHQAIDRELYRATGSGQQRGLGEVPRLLMSVNAFDTSCLTPDGSIYPRIASDRPVPLLGETVALPGIFQGTVQDEGFEMGPIIRFSVFRLHLLHKKNKRGE